MAGLFEFLAGTYVGATLTVFAVLAYSAWLLNDDERKR